jgi:pimeloyl-ACP methyl ester carboxylesterase
MSSPAAAIEHRPYSQCHRRSSAFTVPGPHAAMHAMLRPQALSSETRSSASAGGSASSMETNVMTPFKIEISDAQIADLHARIDATRMPSAVRGVGWHRGIPPAVLAEWMQRWRRFDWRAAEQRLNGYPNYTAEIDGIPVHFIFVRSEADDARPLLLMNGWPSTFAELLPLVELLTRPDRDGRSFHVVIPSLPGFGFSGHPADAGWGPTRIGALMAKLMERLGFPRFGVHGSDVGASIMMAMAHSTPERLIGLHSVNLSWGFPTPDNLTEDEKAWFDEINHWQAEEGAYNKVQATKPHTLAASLSDSPAGMAAWALEKWQSWSDGGLDAYSPDDVLTMLTIFWVTNSLASSIQFYAEMREDATKSDRGKVQTPTGVLIMPEDISHAPRSWGERWFHLVRWTKASHGGHFPALEATSELAAEIRATFEAI